MDLFDIRKDYKQGHLSAEDLLTDPLLQIERWLQDAEQAECMEHNAVVLSTVSAEGGASSRVVLLKKIDKDGLYFFTNYESRKGQQIALNNSGSLLLFWPKLERQVNIEGQIKKCSVEISNDYFNRRPLASRISAVVSQQSQVVENREIMSNLWQITAEQAEKTGISRPHYWGGYVLSPTRIEFWQGGTNRFHDRIVFENKPNGWITSRLMP